VPGAYAEVDWPLRRPAPTLFVPPTAIVQTTERTFVNRVRDGKVEQVAVQRGAMMGDVVEVFGDLAPARGSAVQGVGARGPAVGAGATGAASTCGRLKQNP
jgi:hypothetical protein